MPERRSYLLVPAGGFGDGMGHLSRCLALARELHGAACVFTGYLDADARRTAHGPAQRNRTALKDRLGAGDRFDFIVVDRPSCTRGDVERLSRHGAVVCIDGGGEGRACADYLIDALPRPSDGVQPNAASVSFLNLPEKSRRAPVWPPRKVLVSFGGEDKAHASEAFISVAIARGLLTARSLTVVQGPLFGERHWPEDVMVLESPSFLAEVIPGYDLVVTHFGLTALEAMASGVPVILLNPGRYHERLAGTMGIPSIGTGSPDPGKLAALLKDPTAARKAVTRFRRMREEGDGESLCGHISRLQPPRGAACPVCGAGGNPVIARYPLRTYRRCACGTVHLQSFGPSKEYGRGYFEDEYARQYGRTYLQDFTSIKESGRERLAVIRGILDEAAGRTREPQGSALVDVGCAYGPFLDAAREAGFSPFGIDVSADAVRHVKALGIPAVRANFMSVARGKLPRGPVRVLTFWYVIEHMEDLKGCLRKAASILEPGGVLAFSTPNLSGISGRKNLWEYLGHSPPDHYSVLEPRAMRRVLSEHGLRLRRVRVTGHHPERFPAFLGKSASGSAAVRGALGAVSRFLGLGDTFEAYAVKEGRG